MTLLLLFGSGVPATPPYGLRTSGGASSLRTHGGQATITTSGGTPTITTKGPA